MAYHDTQIWDMHDEVSEINRKIILLWAGSSPHQRKVLLKAQQDLAEWEKNHLHNIRTAFARDSNAKID